MASNIESLPSLHHLQTDLLTIEAGKFEDRKAFVVHKDLLCTSSRYFQSAFEGDWQEAKDEKIKLHHIKSATVGFFVDWLYFRRAPEVHVLSDMCLNCGGPCTRPLDEKAKKKLGWQSPSTQDQEFLDRILDNAVGVIHLYAFGDEFDVPQLREQIVNCTWVRVITAEQPHVQEVFVAFQTLPDNDPLRKLLFDAFGMHFDKSSLTCVYDSIICQRFPSSMWFHLFMMGKNKSNERQSPRIRSLCHYHEHGQDKPNIEACKEMLKSRKRFIDGQMEYMNVVMKGEP